MATSSQCARRAAPLRSATIRTAANSMANTAQISQLATDAAVSHAPEASASRIRTGISASVAGEHDRLQRRMDATGLVLAPHGTGVRRGGVALLPRSLPSRRPGSPIGP